MPTAKPLIGQPTMRHPRHKRPTAPITPRRYVGAVTEPTRPTKPSIEEHARDMGVNPDDLRAFLQSADHTPPTPDQQDDRARLRELLDRP